MGLIQLLLHNPILFVAIAVPLLYSIIAHEVAHGWVAYLFGDDTAMRYGRITLNPLSHLDPIGTIMLFLVGFGWAKPVPVNYNILKHSRFAFVAVALAGCVTNILLAIIALFLLQFPVVTAHPALSTVLSIVARINIVLGAFNLIPIPPLDGSKILMGFLPVQAQENFARLEPYGFFILAFFLFTGMLNTVIIFMQNAIYGIIASLFSIF